MRRAGSTIGRIAWPSDSATAERDRPARIRRAGRKRPTRRSICSRSRSRRSSARSTSPRRWRASTRSAPTCRRQRGGPPARRSRSRPRAPRSSAACTGSKATASTTTTRRTRCSTSCWRGGAGCRSCCRSCTSRWRAGPGSRCRASASRVTSSSATSAAGPPVLLDPFDGGRAISVSGAPDAHAVAARRDRDAHAQQPGRVVQRRGDLTSRSARPRCGSSSPLPRGCARRSRPSCERFRLRLN